MAVSFTFAAMHCEFPRQVGADPPTTRSQPTEQLIRRLIAQLGDASYSERTQAQRELEILLADVASKSQTNTALKASALSADLEIRESARRILRQAEHQAIDSEIAKLLEVAIPANQIDLPMWCHFRKMAGNDLGSRRLFAKLAREHFDNLRHLSRCYVGDAKPSTQTAGPMFANAKLHQLLDPYSIAAEDAALWALLLCVDDPNFRLRLGGLSTRTTLALAQTATGPAIKPEGEFAVIQRMIGNWITKNRGIGLERERLAIAMKYQCHREANGLCDKVLQDRLAAPAAHAMALLCASTLQRPDLEQLLMQRIADQRTAHVWQLIASRKTKIRTQVGDVAVALMLHRQGIDPRDFGFTELQADPLVVFRVHSLGFADDSQRQNAYVKAQRLLGFPLP